MSKKTIILLSLLPLLSIVAAPKAKTPLNVVIILTDNQGIGDIGYFGNPYLKTPHLDQLCSESIRFTNFHSSTTGTPTRAGLMTGCYPHRVGVWHTRQGRNLLDRTRTTLADLFRQNGYATALFGKWGLGDMPPYQPHQRGFETTFYHGGEDIGQTPDYWGNCGFDDTYFRNGIPEKTEGFATDVWFEEAIRFIKSHQKRPFLCLLSTDAYHSEPNETAPYRNNPQIVNPKLHEKVANLDKNLGRLHSQLEQLELIENTLLIYMTTNGTSGGVEVDTLEYPTRGFNHSMRGMKGSPYEGGHRVPLIIRIPGTAPREIEKLSAYIDILPTLAELCNLRRPNPLPLDGISLLPIIKGKKTKERTLFVDTQGEELLQKGKSSCVMTERWRLINGKELYDIQDDPEQKENLAEQHPTTVATLHEAYNEWWKQITAINAASYTYIPLLRDHALRLTTHDLHNDKNQTSAWHQTQIRKGVTQSGYWTIEVEEAGQYTIELYRYPPEANLPLWSKSPEGRNPTNHSPYPKGRSLLICGARVRINENEVASNEFSSLTACCARIKVNLPQGSHRLLAEFVDSQRHSFSAYYVVIR